MTYMPKVCTHASQMKVQVSVIIWPDACRHIRYIRCFCWFYWRNETTEVPYDAIYQFFSLYAIFYHLFMPADPVALPFSLVFCFPY